MVKQPRQLSIGEGTDSSAGSNADSNENNQRSRSAIDVLLGENPTDFQVWLLKLAREFHWDENDPGFAVPLATTQLERVMKDYPQQVKAALEEVARQQKQDWNRMKAATDATALRTQQAAEGLSNRLCETKSLVDLDIAQLGGRMQAERIALAEMMQAERQALRDEFERELEAVRSAADAQQKAIMQRLEAERERTTEMMATERQEMAKLAQQLSEQLQQETRAQTKAVIAEGVVATRERANKQVKEIVAGVRRKHYLEVGLYAIAMAALLVGTSWMMAWVTRGQVEQNSVWGDIERWNKDHLRECVNVGATTCNFHIEVPEHPIEPKR